MSKTITALFLLATQSLLVLVATAEQTTPAFTSIEDARINLPWEEVRELIDRVDELESKASQDAIKPPLGFIHGSADYRVVVGATSTTIDAVFEIDILRDDWQMIPLLGAGPAIIATKVNGRPARLAFDGSRYRFVVAEKGRVRIETTFVLPATGTQEAASLSLPVVGFARNSISLDLPGTDLSVRLDPATITAQVNRNKRTLVTGVFPPTTHIKAWWTAALPAVIEERETLQRCRVSQLISIGAESIRLDARLDFTILHGKIEHIDLQLPLDAIVLEVSGADLHDHRVHRSHDSTLVTLLFAQPVGGELSVRLVAERVLASESSVAGVPELEVLGMDHETGHIALNAASNLELSSASVSGLVPTDIAELPTVLRATGNRPVLLAYKYAQHPYELSLDLERHIDLPVLSTTIDVVWLSTFQIEDGKLLHAALLETRNTDKQFVELQLPPLARILATFVSGRPTNSAIEDGVLLIPLEKSITEGGRQSPFPIEIIYVEDAPALGWHGRNQISAFQADVPISLLRWQLHLSESFHYWNFQGPLTATDQSELPRLRTAADRALNRIRTEDGFRRSARNDVQAVRLALPKTGSRSFFEREFILADDPPILLDYRYLSSRITSTIRGGLALFTYCVAAAALLVLLSIRKGARQLNQLRLLAQGVSGLFVLVAADIWIFGPSLPTIVGALIALLICLDAHACIYFPHLANGAGEKDTSPATST